MTQRHRVLDALRQAGTAGVTNGQFIDMRILRFGARIEELREAGYEIETVRVSQGTFRYTLTDTPAPPRREARSIPDARRDNPLGPASDVSRPEGADALFQLDPSPEQGRSAITGKRLAA